MIPRREKKFRARRAGFPPRAGTRDSPAEDVVSATGEDERTHTPCGERSAPPSLWGGIAATALLRRAASTASDAGSSCVGRPESIQSKGAPAAPRAVGNKREWGAGSTSHWEGKSAAFGRIKRDGGAESTPLGGGKKCGLWPHKKVRPRLRREMISAWKRCFKRCGRAAQIKKRPFGHPP